MLRYKKEGIVISVALPETNYIVRMTANWNFEEKMYHCTMEIRRNDIYKFIEIPSMATKIKSTPKEISREMAVYITTRFNNYEFTKEIEFYELEDMCFNKGLSIIENEKTQKSKRDKKRGAV